MEFVELNEIGSGEFGSVFKCLNRLGTVTAVYVCIMYFNQPFPPRPEMPILLFYFV